MARSAIALAALAGVAAAASGTTTVSLIAPHFTGLSSLGGSVVGVDSEKTTYAVGCLSGDKAATCSVISSQTIIQGPSTWEMNYSVGHKSMSNAENLAQCVVDFSQETAQCQITISDVENGELISTVMTTALTSLKESMVPITVTAGADKLSPSPSAGATTATVANTKPTMASTTSTSPSMAASQSSSTSSSSQSVNSSSQCRCASSSVSDVPSGSPAPQAQPSTTMSVSGNSTTPMATSPSSVTKAAAGHATGHGFVVGLVAAAGALFALY